ncbi:hypothetical protein FHW36_1011605 [Chitinophaga polysaccharea]|uniref:Uncharacterized protein n=1 Tax=Chitinophaga polysaccharea TaxID=1293035 RepID=A0A561Q5M7_9BACT|nr:hypothetical protein FHW36_1011605 [Chitinophaga polysaccharea]
MIATTLLKISVHLQAKDVTSSINKTSRVVLTFSY